MAADSDDAKRRFPIRPPGSDVDDFAEREAPRQSESYTIIPAASAASSAAQASADEAWAELPTDEAPEPATGAGHFHIPGESNDDLVYFEEIDDDEPDPDEEAEEEDFPQPHIPDPASRAITSQEVQDRIEKIVDGLDGLEHLSELVSLRYNPFLEIGESDVFDGKRLRPDELIQGFFSPTGSPKEVEAPDFMDVGRRVDVDSDEELDLTDLPVEHIHQAVQRRKNEAWGDAPPDEPDDGDDDPARARMTAPRPTPPPTGNTRPTLLVLAWFREIQERSGPEAIYLYLDHYRNLGWLDEETHAWFEQLASAIAPRNEELTWTDLGINALDMTRIHEANLLFLDDLFTDRLRPGERRYLTRHIGQYFAG